MGLLFHIARKFGLRTSLPELTMPVKNQEHDAHINIRTIVIFKLSFKRNI